MISFVPFLCLPSWLGVKVYCKQHAEYGLGSELLKQPDTERALQQYHVETVRPLSAPPLADHHLPSIARQINRSVQLLPDPKHIYLFFLKHRMTSSAVAPSELLNELESFNETREPALRMGMSKS